MTSNQQRPIIVFDTSVLDTDPTAVYAYPDTDIVVPLIVLQELDNQKNRQDEVGAAARRVRNLLEELRVKNNGSLESAADLGNGATLRIATNGLHLDKLKQQGLDTSINDVRIVASAIGQQDTHPGTEVTVLSQDISLRIIAAHVGLKATEHVVGAPTDSTDSVGWHNLYLSSDSLTLLHDQHSVYINELDPTDQALLKELEENEFAQLQGALVQRKGDKITKLSNSKPTAFGLKPLSTEQRFALELLLDPEVPIVALDGQAGVGKTILAIAAALQAILEDRSHYKLSFFRPPIMLRNMDIGFLPGSKDEKLAEHYLAVEAALVALTLSDDSKATPAEKVKAAKMNLAKWLEEGLVEYGSIGHVRGRTLADQIIIVDEAQNVEVGTIKTLLTRTGKNSKIILLGDTSSNQIDNTYVSSTTNGLTVAIKALSGSPLFGHIKLQKTERSEVADLAARKL